MLVALKWGALVGVATYIVANVAITALGLLLFPHTDVTNPGVLIIACLGLFVLLFAFSTSGYFAGRETRRAGLGAVAGMVTLAVYALLKALYTPGAQTTSQSATGNATGNLIAQGVAAIFFIGIAAAIGWLGGRPGAQNGRKRLARTEPAAPVVKQDA